MTKRRQASVTNESFCRLVIQPSHAPSSHPPAQGACGYGTILKNKYPYFSVAALSLSNQFSVAGPLKGCGQCFQIQCTDEREGVCVKDSSGSPKSIIVMISGEGEVP